jgi:hypothetical protein
MAIEIEEAKIFQTSVFKQQFIVIRCINVKFLARISFSINPIALSNPLKRKGSYIMT